MQKTYLISSHLLARWMERIEGIDLNVFRRAADRMGRPVVYDNQLVEFMEEYSAVDFDRMRAEIGKLLTFALARGASSIRANGVRIPITTSRTGVTAIPMKRNFTHKATPGRGSKRRIEERAFASDDAVAIHETDA